MAPEEDVPVFIQTSNQSVIALRFTEYGGRKNRQIEMAGVAARRSESLNVFRPYDMNNAYFKRILVMGVDAKCIKNLKTVRQKLPTGMLCNEDRCTSMKKRFEDHQKKCNGLFLITQNTQTMTTQWMERLVQTCDVNQAEVAVACDLQQGCNAHFDDIYEPPNSCVDDCTEDKYNMPGLSQSCNSSISFKKFYKDRLQYEVLQWLREVPIETEFNSIGKVITEKIVNNLIENINKLHLQAHQDDYEDKLKCEVIFCLNSLPLANYVARCDDIKYILADSLITRIMLLNSKYLNLSHSMNSCQQSANRFRSCSNSRIDIEMKPMTKIYKREISRWLKCKRFGKSDGTAVSVKVLTKSLLNRLIPLLTRRREPRNLKYLLRGEIIETLERLLYNCGSTINSIQISGLAAELTDKLLLARDNIEKTKSGQFCRSLTKNCTKTCRKGNSRNYNHNEDMNALVMNNSNCTYFEPDRHDSKYNKTADHLMFPHADYGYSRYIKQNKIRLNIGNQNTFDSRIRDLRSENYSWYTKTYGDD